MVTAQNKAEHTPLKGIMCKSVKPFLQLFQQLSAKTVCENGTNSPKMMFYLRELCASLILHCCVSEWLPMGTCEETMAHHSC